MLITNLLSSLLLVPLLLVDQDNENVEGTAEEVESILNLTAKFNQSEAILSKNIFIENVNDKKLFYEKESIVIDNATEEIEVYKYYANVTEIRNDFLCYLAQGSTSLVCTTSIFSILLIGIDQYFAVIHSLRYHSYMNKFKSLLLISTTWILSVFFAFVGVLTHKDSSLWKFCHQNNKHEAKTMKSVYAIIYVVLVILLPFIAICSIYACIYRAAHRNSERMRQSTSAAIIDSLQLNLKNQQQHQQLPKVRSAPNFVTFQTETRFVQQELLKLSNELVPLPNAKGENAFTGK